MVSNSIANYKQRVSSFVQEWEKRTFRVGEMPAVVLRRC